MTRSIERIVAVGAGRMGRGIATAFAYAGCPITILDLKARPAADARRLEAEALSEVRSSLMALCELGALSEGDVDRVVARIRFADANAAQQVLATADLVFEGVPETLDAKKDAFTRLSAACRPDAILASTTSTMLSTELAGLVSHPERFLNAHWLNPAYLVPLVEISPHPGTDQAVVDALRALLEQAGKVPVVCKASPGYIVPRLQGLIMNEAARMVEEGVATAAEIDRATRFGLGFRFASIGVVEFIDYGGTEILYHGAGYLARTISAERYATPAIVSTMMKAGEIGLKSGKGFYEYPADGIAAYRKDVLARALHMLRSMGLYRPPA